MLYLIEVLPIIGANINQARTGIGSNHNNMFRIALDSDMRLFTFPEKKHQATLWVIDGYGALVLIYALSAINRISYIVCWRAIILAKKGMYKSVFSIISADNITVTRD